MADEVLISQSENQSLQHQLVRQAEKEPSIREALAAYQTVLPYLPAEPVEAPPRVQYATGGNS